MQMRLSSQRDESLAGQDNTLASDWERDANVVLPGSVSALFLEAWDNGSEDAIYRLLAIEVAPRLLSHLASAYRLQEADCEDCLSNAYDRFAPAIHSRTLIRNPYAYFFKTGINAALQLLRDQQGQLIDADQPADAVADPGGPDAVWVAFSDLQPDLAVELVEDAVSEVEVEDFWAVEIVRLAVGRLSPALRRVTESLLYKDLAFGEAGAADFDYSAEDSGAELDMKPGTFRTAKHRAYAAIRELVPALIIEMGITPPERAEEAIFPEGRGRFMGDDPGL